MLTNSPARGPNTPSTLVVGTSEGVLLVYDIVPSSDGTANPTAVVASYAERSATTSPSEHERTAQNLCKKQANYAASDSGEVQHANKLIGYAFMLS